MAQGEEVMRLVDLLRTYRPESWGGTRGDTWPEHARYLWALDPDYLVGLVAHMQILGGWFSGPVVVDDGVVQDGHHRLVTASELGWDSLLIAVQPVRIGLG